MGKLLTTAEAAERLTLSRQQVYAFLKEGAIPCVRLGGAIRVAEADVEAFIRKNYNGDPQAAAVGPAKAAA